MDLWEPKRRIERAFQRSLLNLAAAIIQRVGTDAEPDVLIKTLHILASSAEFKNFAEQAALKMVTQLFEDQGRTWREAAKHSSRGRSIYQALMKELSGKTGQILTRQVERNAELIRTLPSNIASDVANYTATEALKGRRASDIALEIARKFPEQTKARADMVSHLV